MWLPQRVCCLAVGWFRHGLLLRRGPAQPASGRERSRAGSTSFRERTLTCWLNQLEGRKLVEPACSHPEEHPLGFTPQLSGFRHVCTPGGVSIPRPSGNQRSTMNQSPQNANPSKPEPSGSGAPDFMLGEPTGQVGEASEPVGASTGSADAATGQSRRTDEAAAFNRYLYAPEQSSSRYDPYAAGQFPPQRWEDPNSDSVASWVGVVLLMVIALGEHRRGSGYGVLVEFLACQTELRPRHPARDRHLDRCGVSHRPDLRGAVQGRTAVTWRRGCRPGRVRSTALLPGRSRGRGEGFPPLQGFAGAQQAAVVDPGREPDRRDGGEDEQRQ